MSVDSLPDSEKTTPTDVELRRAHACVETLLIGLRKAQQHGGKNAKMHVGDVIHLIEEFQKGTMDHGAPVTGPHYSRDVQ